MAKKCKSGHSKVEYMLDGGRIACARCGTIRNLHAGYSNLNSVRIGCNCKLCRKNFKKLSEEDRKVWENEKEAILG